MELRPDLAASLGALPPDPSEIPAESAAVSRSRSAFAIAASDPATPEYAMRAGYWCAALTILFPVLVLPSLAFGFLVARRGRLAAGIVLTVVAGIALWISVILFLLLTGNLSNSSGQ